MKKVGVVLIGGLLLGLFGAGGYLLVSKNTAKIVSPNGVEVSPTAAPHMLNWDDPAGFTVSYPEGLVINKHDEDTVNYAHVEFTAPGKPGSIIFWVKDIPPGATDTGDWVKMDASLSAGMTFDTALGGQPGQKILLSAAPKKEIVGIVYDDALFYVDITLGDGTYWQAVADRMLQSFTFKPINVQTGNNSGNSASDDSSTVDEEEVLQ